MSAYVEIDLLIRERAIEILMSEIPTLPNDTIVALLNMLPKSQQGKRFSCFDDFGIVCQYVIDDPN